MPENRFDATALGTWSDPATFDVDADRISAYARATNDPVPEHLGGAVAPPVFAVLPAWDVLAGGVLAVAPLDVLMLLVHGEQQFVYHRPITPGMRLVARSAPVGVFGKRAGVTVVVKGETRTPDGTLVTEQWMTTFFRGVADRLDADAGEDAPAHQLAEELRAAPVVAEVVQDVDADQPRRYADASGDVNPIHLDEEFAVSVGLPGVIVHGLCTMAFASHAALTAVGKGAPLRRYAVRFSRPVRPGAQLTTRFWERPGTPRGYGFETVSDAGDVVLKDGLVEFDSGD